MIVCSEGEHTEETRIALGFHSTSGGSWAFALLAGVRGHSLNLSGSSEGNGAWEVKGGKRSQLQVPNSWTAAMDLCINKL